MYYVCLLYTYRMLVGYISGAYNTTVPKAAVIANLPIITKVVVTQARLAPLAENNNMHKLHIT